MWVGGARPRSGRCRSGVHPGHEVVGVPDEWQESFPLDVGWVGYVGSAKPARGAGLAARVCTPDTKWLGCRTSGRRASLLMLVGVGLVMLGWRSPPAERAVPLGRVPRTRSGRGAVRVAGEFPLSYHFPCRYRLPDTQARQPPCGESLRRAALRTASQSRKRELTV